MDLYKNGSISYYLKILKDDEIIKWMLCISNGLIIIHNENIIHRDIKPANLLFDNNNNINNNNNIKLVDFGLVINPEEKSMSINGTIGYMSPEQLVGPCDYSCDIWSMGIVLFELLTKKLQYCFSLPDKIINEKFPSKYYCNELKIILLKLLNLESKNRPNALDIKIEFIKILNNIEKQENKEKEKQKEKDIELLLLSNILSKIKLLKINLNDFIPITIMDIYNILDTCIKYGKNQSLDKCIDIIEFNIIMQKQNQNENKISKISTNSNGLFFFSFCFIFSFKFK